MLPVMLLLFIFLLTAFHIQISCQHRNSFKNELKRLTRDAPYCSYRCSRIYQRSLNRMNKNVESVQYLFERLQPIEDISDACWKSYDFLDCMEHCELQNRHRLAVIRNVIEDRCRKYVKGNETNLACISKYHTFIDIQCSTYLSEAANHIKHAEHRSLQQSCRYIQYHNLCLINTMSSYCPNATRLFTRANLRNYFLSFLLPINDRQFSDDFLDECQMYDLRKLTEVSLWKVEGQPVISATEAIFVTDPDVQNGLTNMISSTEETIITMKESKAKVKASFKKLFSPDEDLIDTPPNFFYSSLRSLGRERLQQNLHRESSAIKHSKVYPTVVNNNKKAKAASKTIFNDLQPIKTLPTDSTGDEYFNHLIYPNQLTVPLATEPDWSDAMTSKSVKISRPKSVKSAEIAMGEVIYVHHNDPQVDEKNHTTETADENSVLTINDHSTTNTVTATGTYSTTSPPKIATSETYPTTPDTSDYAELLDQINIQAYIPKINDAYKPESTAVMQLLQLSYINSSRSPPTATTTVASKNVTVYKIFQNIPKTKTYKIVPLPTIVTSATIQRLVPEDTKQQTKSLNTATLSNKEVLYETKLLSKLRDDTLWRTTITSQNVKTTMDYKKYLIGRYDGHSDKMVYKDGQNKTKEFEKTLPQTIAVVDDHLTLNSSAGPDIKGTGNDHSDLLFIYAFLIFVSFISVVVLLTNMMLCT